MREIFPSQELVLITNCREISRKVKKTEIEIWECTDPKIEWLNLYKNLNHPMDFRDAFWFNTIARFFVLNDYMRINPTEAIIQIEGDVFPFPSFPFESFLNLRCDIAYPLESNEMGIASLLFLRNAEASRKFVEIIRNEIFGNPRHSDMSILGKIAKSNLMNFEPISTLPRELSYALKSIADAKMICDMNSKIEGVFDGITYGQYLLGVDPRNSRGVSRLFSVQTSHSIDPSKLNFEFDRKSQSLKLVSNDSSWLIYNLHNHSKDLRLYSTRSRNKLLLKRINDSFRGPQNQIYFSVFARLVYNYFRKRLRIL